MTPTGKQHARKCKHNNTNRNTQSDLPKRQHTYNNTLATMCHFVCVKFDDCKHSQVNLVYCPNRKSRRAPRLESGVWSEFKIMLSREADRLLDHWSNPSNTGFRTWPNRLPFTNSNLLRKWWDVVRVCYDADRYQAYDPKWAGGIESTCVSGICLVCANNGLAASGIWQCDRKGNRIRMKDPCDSLWRRLRCAFLGKQKGEHNDAPRVEVIGSADASDAE